MILEEPQQIDLNVRIDGIFTAIGLAEKIDFDVSFIQVDRDRLDESFVNCKC